MSRGPRVAVVVFPGTWSERDFAHAAELIGWEGLLVWHAETELPEPDAVVLPGGFAHGDHLRTGAIARFSPVMRAVEAFAAAGGPVLGSCNGFQILTEAGILPGALLRNDHLEFRCDWQSLRVERAAGPWLGGLEEGETISLPISHGEGRYYADQPDLDELERTGRVALRYADAAGAVGGSANPNGSLRSIAGIVNEGGNVLGLMPHPERCAEDVLGNDDGRLIFLSMLDTLKKAKLQPVAVR